MPTRPRPGCPVLNCPYTQPCPLHPRRETWNLRPRPKTLERGYAGRKYLLWRAQVFAEHPVCAGCGAPPQDGDAADHLIPLSRRPDLAYEPANGQRLCRRCHAIKSQRESQA
jgi:5-methylcytosine-specific restriction endonuclease McrA